MIVVVGAGITGLALAHWMRLLDIRHQVLEAADRPGGVIRSARVEGHLLEWGPQRTRLTAGVRELVDEIGLAGELVTAPPGLPLFVYARGRLRRAPFSAGDFVRTDLLPWPAKLRVLLEPLSAGARAEESVADYFTRKLGRRAYEDLVGPLYGGLYASDPADMVVGTSLGHVLREFGIGRSLLLPLLGRGGKVAPPAACSFREGMQALTDRLYGAWPDSVRLGTPVTGLSRAGEGWRVETGGGALEAEQVVLTVPAPAAARLLAGPAPAAAERIARLTYNPLAVVHLLADAPLRGLGFQVSLAESLATRGVTFNDSLFGRSGVYTAYLGGAKRPDVVSLSEEEIGSTAVREFRAITGCEARVLAVARERMPAWDRSWAALEGLSLPPGLHLAANWESRPGIPGRLAQARRLAERLAGASRSVRTDPAAH